MAILIETRPWRPFVRFVKRSARGTVALLLLAGVVGCDPTDVITHDITPPSVAIAGIANGETIIDPRGVTVSATDADSDIRDFLVFFDGSQIYRTSPNAKSVGTSFTLLTGRENAGNHTITVQAYDAAGNSRELGLAYTVFAP